jgi:metal-sulfur cluster biosynthetic enzyme
MTGARAPDRAELMQALRDVYDPCCADRGISIVDMGVVEDVRVEDEHVSVDLVPTTGWCPFVANMSSAIPDRLLSSPHHHIIFPSVSAKTRGWREMKLTVAAIDAYRFG